MQDLRRYADLVASLLEALAPIAVPAKRRRFIGTSETCFDGSRFECVDDRLPWFVWHDLLAGLAEAEEVSLADFYSENGIPDDVREAVDGHPSRYLVCQDGAGVLRDLETGVHYFFIWAEARLAALDKRRSSGP